MMEVVVTSGAIKSAEFQSNRYYQQTITQLFTGQMPFLSPNQKCRHTEGKTQHSAVADKPRDASVLTTFAYATVKWLCTVFLVEY